MKTIRSTPTAKPKARPPSITFDPVAFWRAQHAQAKKDCKAARDSAVSVLPKLVQLEREAWREWKSAQAAAGPEVPGKPTSTEPADTSLEAQLATATRMRRSAEAAGSFVAASKLLQAEGAIADQIRLRDELAEKARRRALNPEEFRAALVAKMKAMPVSMQAQVRAAMGW